jgi:hypothetical protein
VPFIEASLDRTFKLHLGHSPREVPLEGKGAPETLHGDIMDAKLEEHQIGHERDRYRAPDPLGGS